MRPVLAPVVLDLQVDADLPEIPADPMQVDQVMTNLLENAARHSPVGGTVRIRVLRDGDAIRVRVADDGPGIPSELREKVFEAFYRGREEPERPGSGLGLAIAQAIVTAHGGRIWVDPSTEGGSALIFELPVEEVSV
jgi:signal transduction histidine kinase